MLYFHLNGLLVGLNFSKYFSVTEYEFFDSKQQQGNSKSLLMHACMSKVKLSRSNALEWLMCPSAITECYTVLLLISVNG